MRRTIGNTAKTAISAQIRNTDTIGNAGRIGNIAKTAISAQIRNTDTIGNAGRIGNTAKIANSFQTGNKGENINAGKLFKYFILNQVMAHCLGMHALHTDCFS